MNHRRPSALVPTLALALAACGGDSDAGAEAYDASVPTADEGSAPVPDQGGRAAYLTLMGEDTLAMEWLAFDGNSVDAQAIIRGARTMYGDYHLAFDDDGTVTSYRADTWEGTDDSGPMLRSERLEEGADGPELVVVQNGEERRAPLELEPGAVPFVDMLHWGFEASMRWQREAHGQLQAYVPAFSTRGISEFELVANDDGTWQLVHPSRGPSTMEIDDEGRILWLDGTGSTRAYDLTRVAWDELDRDGLAAQFANRPMGELSGRGQVDDRVAGVRFTGHYGEPLKRGRDIFGSLVAYGEWWRTGANQATHLSFDRDIEVDGVVIPAGDYTLSSIPEEDGGTLIINRQTGQGGQSYDETMDEARVEMRRDTLDEVVEAFEIRAVETDEGGRLELRWDDTVYWVPFTTP